MKPRRSHPCAVLGMALLTMTLLLPLGMYPAPTLADGPTNTFTGAADGVAFLGLRPTGSMGSARYEHTALNLTPPLLAGV